MYTANAARTMACPRSFPKFPVEATERALEKAVKSFKTQHVSSLTDAIASLQNHRIDVVVLDLGLPDAAGIESVAKIRKSAAGVPIVVLTGWDDAFARKIIAAGAQEYLSKSEIENGLVAAIENAILKMPRGASQTMAYRNLVADETRDNVEVTDLKALVTQLRLSCGDLILNHPELLKLEEVQQIARTAKQIYEQVDEVEQTFD